MARKARIRPFTSLNGFQYGNDAAGNMAIFLLNETGSIFGKWCGRLSAADQRQLFGRVVGKGILIVDGNAEEVHHEKTVCFGTMIDRVLTLTWRELSSAMLNAKGAAQ